MGTYSVRMDERSGGMYVMFGRGGTNREQNSAEYGTQYNPSIHGCT
jgi:hypothetical protein